MKLTRDEELQRYRTEVWVNGIRHATFDQERYYREMPTQEMIQLRDKTVRDLQKVPPFAPEFYGKFVEYLDTKLAQRHNLGDWLWRNIVLKIDLAAWTITTRVKKKYFGVEQ